MTYAKLILDTLHCEADEAKKIEHVMREDVIRGPLDDLSDVGFRRAARKASKALNQNRDVYDEWFAKTRAMFEQMQCESELTKKSTRV